MNLDTYATTHGLGHGAAIEHAHAQGWTLNTYNDPTADAVEDCTVEYAQDCAQADPGLVWMTEPTVVPSRNDDDTRLLIENLDSLCGQRMDNAHDMGNDISLEDCVGYLRVCFGHDGGHFIVECIKSYNEGRDEDSDDQWELAPLLAQWDAPGSDDDGVQQVFDALDAVLASYTHRCAHSGCSQNYIDTGDTSCVDGETS